LAMNMRVMSPLIKVEAALIPTNNQLIRMCVPYFNQVTSIPNNQSHTNGLKGII
jgi:hypothetical protein